MTEDDKFALKEFITGAGVVVGVIAALLIVLFVLANGSTDVSNPTSSNAEVVGKYKECDIIQWTQHNLAEYKYFLYCEKNK
jgi:hypothetical protein